MAALLIAWGVFALAVIFRAFLDARSAISGGEHNRVAVQAVAEERA
jgi:hypothetical protein